MSAANTARQPLSASTDSPRSEAQAACPLRLRGILYLSENRALHVPHSVARAREFMILIMMGTP